MTPGHPRELPEVLALGHHDEAARPHDPRELPPRRLDVRQVGHHADAHEQVDPVVLDRERLLEVGGLEPGVGSGLLGEPERRLGEVESHDACRVSALAQRSPDQSGAAPDIEHGARIRVAGADDLGDDRRSLVGPCGQVGVVALGPPVVLTGDPGGIRGALEQPVVAVDLVGGHRDSVPRACSNGYRTASGTGVPVAARTPRVCRDRLDRRRSPPAVAGGATRPRAPGRRARGRPAPGRCPTSLA